MLVPPTTPVRRNRVRNVDSARLVARRAFLQDLLITDGGRSLPTRHQFAMRAAEFCAIEAELARRDLSPGPAPGDAAPAAGFPDSPDPTPGPSTNPERSCS